MVSLLLRKISKLHLPLLCLVLLMVCGGFVLLYSAAGSFSPYVNSQFYRVIAGITLMIIIAIVDIRDIYNSSYILYVLGTILLVTVIISGSVGMGAKRWLVVGGVNIQPSEICKIVLILAFAKFYHGKPTHALNTMANLTKPIAMALFVAILVVIQPDLGTAITIIFIALSLMFVAGVSGKFFWMIAGVGVISMPILWTFMHEYQKKRILVFLEPESDPLGAGYHLLQSKIAIGSSGFWGKGFMQGSQSHLMFLPEKHTDFIFTLLTEDFGMVGALLLIIAYVLFVIIGLIIASRSQSIFGSIVAMGVTFMVFIHALINMGMVMGLFPVVGIPLPFISYGGSSMLTMFIGVGLLMNVHIHRDIEISSGTGLNPERNF